MDAFSLGGWRQIFLYVLWGVFACFVAWGCNQLWPWDNVWGAPVLEELLKCLPLLWFIWRRKVAFLAETLLFGAAIGTGFALLENTLYLLYVPDFPIGNALIRGLGTALLHMGCVALNANIVLVCHRWAEAKEKKFHPVFCIVGFVPAILLHICYNLFLLPPFIQLCATLLVFVIFFIGMYEWDASLIHRWLDESIFSDITLLGAIRRGEFKTTRQGMYLIQMRDRFQMEVFFDICMYVTLYLELTIAARSRMILREAGMDSGEDEKAHAETLNKLAELKELRNRIGTTAMTILKPILHIQSTDLHSLAKMAKN